MPWNLSKTLAATKKATYATSANISSAKNLTQAERGQTLARAFVTKTVTEAQGHVLQVGTLARAMAGRVLPKPPIAAAPEFTANTLGNPKIGASRLPGRFENPADKHDRLYRGMIHPAVKALPYRPAWGFLKSTLDSAESKTEAYGNTLNRKLVDRSLRATFRDEIDKQKDDKLRYSVPGNPNRLTGLDYLRMRKSRPNVPSGVRGTSRMVTKLVTLQGKFSGARDLPIHLQTRLTAIPTGAKKFIPAITTALQKPPATYSILDTVKRMFGGTLGGNQ